MTWVLVAVGAWLLCAVLAALVIGRSIRIADQRAAEQRAAEHLVAERDALRPNVVFDPLHAPDESDAGIPTPTDTPAVEQLTPPPPSGRRAVGDCVPSSERKPSSRGAWRH